MQGDVDHSGETEVPIMPRSVPSGLAALKSALPDLAAEARRRALEFEELRQLPDDYVARLKAAGVYRILVDPGMGGLGGTLPDWLAMVAELAEADGSTGWAAAHGAVCSALVANIADQGFAAEALGDPGVGIAWSNLPRVREARAVPGGLRITGEWAFATGCTGATYLGGMFPRPGSDPEVRIVALARMGEATVRRTWDPVGLAGTGSHSVVFDDIFVPDRQIFEWPWVTITSKSDTAIVATGTWMITLCAAATHLGIARRALDEARQKLNLSSGASTGLAAGSNQETIRALERAEGIHLSCRLALFAVADAMWKARKQLPATPDREIREASLVGATAVHQCAEVVRIAYAQGGAAAIARAGVLQKCLRDSSCLTHHVAANGNFFEAMGRRRLGLDGMGYQFR